MDFKILKIERRTFGSEIKTYFKLLQCHSFLGFKWTTTVRDRKRNPLSFRFQTDVTDYINSVNRIEEFEQGHFKAPKTAPVSSMRISGTITPGSEYSSISYPHKIV